MNSRKIVYFAIYQALAEDERRAGLFRDSRSQTPSSPPAPCDELTQIALSLRDKVGLDIRQNFRLAGVGLGNFRDPGEGTEPSLFDDADQ